LVKEDIKAIWEELGDFILSKNAIITLEDSEQIMVKNNNCYKFNQGLLEDQILNILQAQKIKGLSHNINETLKYIKLRTKYNRDNFTYNSWIISFKNGIYYIEDDKFHKNTIEFDEKPEPIIPTNEWIKKYRPILFYELPFKYDSKNKTNCREFKKALRKWLTPKNIVRPADIFEIYGYFMSLSNSLKTSFLLYGKPDTAKTQLANILIYILGEKENVSSVSLQRLNQRFGSRPLEFKIANIYTELPNTKLFDVGVFKACTGGDKYIPAEIKGGKIYSFQNSARFLFTANQIPPMNNIGDLAFFNRNILIYFPTIYERGDKNRIEDFAHTIINDPNEIKGIIKESIKGIRRLYKRGYFRLELYENTRHIWTYESDPLYAFLYDFIDRVKGEDISQKEFCENYNNYLLSKGRETKKQNSITSELQRFNIGVTQHFKESERYYSGIKWKIDPQYKLSEELTDSEEQLTLFDKQFGNNNI